MAFGGRSQLKMSEETFDFVCTACAQNGKTTEAVKYCVECSGYCCQSCTDTHNWLPILKTHNLMEVNQGNQASGQQAKLLEIPTERCSIHVAKVVDMYCEGHDAVGCSTCFVKDHKSCPDSQIHSIPDMIDTLFKLSDCKKTQSTLKDMMESMAKVSKSKDKQLQLLDKAKKEALDQVTVCQKALEAIVRKAAKSSRQEVESVYKDLETEVLQDKQAVDNIYNSLQTADEKLSQSDGNRAQKFVCSKLAQDKIKDCGREKMKQDLLHRPDVQIGFIPDQSLMKYIKALQGIGQVQKHDLYKIKGSRVINIKLSDDSALCTYIGCCVTPDNHLLVTDFSNKKLKRIDIQKLSVVDYCTLDARPVGVCCISKQEVAVACQSDSKIQLVSIHNKMTPTRQIKMSHMCYGIAFNDCKLYVTYDKSLYIYDMTGTLLKTISQDNAGNKLFNAIRHIAFSESGNKMFVGGGGNVVACFDGLGEYLSTITDADLRDADGVCVDGRGNMFVVGYKSHNVIQYSENGKKVGVVLKQGDGLQGPRSVCFHQGPNRLFVTMQNRNEVSMYELE